MSAHTLLHEALELLNVGGHSAICSGVDRVRARILRWQKLPSVTSEAVQNVSFNPNVKDEARCTSLGMFSQLPDLVILSILERLQSQDLRKLMQVSSTWHIFSCTESLWANITLAEFKDAALPFHSGIWRATNALMKSRISNPNSSPPQLRRDCPPPSPVFIARPSFHSPLLYGKWCREHLALDRFECPLSAIDAIESCALDPASFTSRYDHRCLPVLLVGGAARWKSFELYGPASGPGGMHRFCMDYSELRLRVSHSFQAAGSLRCKLADYSSYCLCQHDEVPLYVFDAKFVSIHEPLRSLYEIPIHFQHDMFSYLGSTRPSYRWLVMGPARCGAPWHIDPIGTSAWNGLVCGRKRWAMYPPGRIPPGVNIFGDDLYGGVQSPPSASWYCEVYPKLLPHERPLEIMQRPGDVIYVPAGWWHLVLNLDDTIAFTQNFVSPSNFALALSEMRSQSSQLYYMYSVSVPQELMSSFPGLLHANASAQALSQRLQLPQGDPPHCTAAAFLRHLHTKFSHDSSLKQLQHPTHALVQIMSALVCTESYCGPPPPCAAIDKAINTESLLPLLLVPNSLNPLCERLKKMLSPRVSDSPSTQSWRSIVSNLLDVLGQDAKSMTCPGAGESAVWLARDCVFKVVTISCAQPLHYALAEAAALRLLFCDEQNPDSVAKEVVALCSVFDDDSRSEVDARLCVVAHSQELARIVSHAAYPALVAAGALAISDTLLGGHWNPRLISCGDSVEVALRPTMDDGSSSDSDSDSDSDCSGSGSSSDGDCFTSTHCNSLMEEAFHSQKSDDLQNASSSSGQAEASPHQWFWSGFISVRRLPGVALRRLSNGPPKHRRRDGVDDACIAARFLACDGLEQANRLAILAVPFAHVLADVHRRQVQGCDAWMNWNWFIKWQHDKAQANIAYSTVVSSALIRALPDWLPAHDWIGWRCGQRPPSLLHGDATCDNCIVTWQHSASAAHAAAVLESTSQAGATCAPLVSLIDFADCRIGPPLYDFVAAWLSGLSCSPTAIKSFRDSYSRATGYDPLFEAFVFASRQPFRNSKGALRCISSEAEMFLCLCMLHVGARGALTALEASGCTAVGRGQSWDEIVAFVSMLLA